ncbi:MAG: autotransporter-associated beta strand repeat-containing protein [Thermoguttaceae bacterium]|nr:autotransporter-associated beta strand repeat-containing protein [Thermoguttaceae bacterium]
MTFTGNIKGSGRLEVLADSGWVIMGTKCADNAFTGDVQTNWTDNSNYGKMRLAADQPFGANAGQGNIYGTLDMNGFSQIFKGLHNDGDKGSIYNNLTTLSTLTLDTTGKDLTFQSSIKGNIALVIKGTGKQTLSKTVAYTGSTTIESGTLALTSNSSTSNKLYNLSGAGNLDYGSSPLELFNTADTVFSGKLSGSGKLTFQNGSGWIELGLTADETFTGNVQINYANSNSQGRVRLGADNALGTANRAFIYGTLDMNGHNQSFAGLSNDGNKGPIFNDADTLSTLTIDNISEDLRFQSSISGNVALVLTGTENGKLTLAKAPEYTGPTTVQAGTLALSQGGTLYNLSGGSADLAAAIDSTGKNLTLENTENTKFIGSIAAAAITKTGEGTLKVNTGETGAIMASSLTVTGGEFDLLGSSTGGLTISNAVFSPGNSVGAAEVGGAFTLTDGASVIMEIGGSAPSQNDSLVASGDLELGDGKIYLTLADACDLPSGGQFTAVFSGSNSASIKNNFIDDHVISYYFSDLAYVPYGEGQYAITGILDANALPEPSAWLLLLCGAFGLLYFRKRK